MQVAASGQSTYGIWVTYQSPCVSEGAGKRLVEAVLLSNESAIRVNSRFYEPSPLIPFVCLSSTLTATILRFDSSERELEFLKFNVCSLGSL